MLREVLHHLTTDQRRALADVGIDRQRLWTWAHGTRLPTEEQAALLADIAGCDWSGLAAFIAIERAKPERRDQVRRAVGNTQGRSDQAGAASVLAMLAAAGAAIAAFLFTRGHGGGTEVLTALMCVMSIKIRT